MRALLLSILILLAGCQTTREVAPVPSSTLSTDNLAAHFEAIAFSSDDGSVERDQLIRWTVPIRWTIASGIPGGWLRIHDRLQQQFATLAAVTGLDIAYVEDRDLANFKVAYTTKAELTASLRHTGGYYAKMANSAPWRRAACYASVRRTPSGQIMFGWIAIGSEADDTLLRSCIVVETTQAMGILRDAAAVRPSVAEEGYLVIDTLPKADEIILRTLYDPRLKPGMTKAEAMPIARQIIGELWQD